MVCLMMSGSIIHHIVREIKREGDFFSLTPVYAGEAEDGLFFFPKEHCRSSLKSGLTNKR